MYCNNCGKVIDDGAAFCTNCGKRLDAVPSITTEEQEADIPAEVQTAEQPVQEQNQTYTSYNPYNNGIYEKPADTFTGDYGRVQDAEEKVYFGKGALAFCLVVIGLLAISTGVFAGLYFSLI